MWKSGHSFHGLAGPLEATHERDGKGQPWKRGHCFLGQADKELACPLETNLGIIGCCFPEMALQRPSGTVVANCDIESQFPQAVYTGTFLPCRHSPWNRWSQHPGLNLHGLSSLCEDTYGKGGLTFPGLAPQVLPSCAEVSHIRRGS